MKSQKGKENTMLVMFGEMAEGLTKLQPESRHRIIDSVLFWFCGEDTATPCTDQAEALIVEMIKSRQRAYEEKRAKRRTAGAKGGHNSHLLDFAQAKPTSISISKSISNSMSTSKSDSMSGESKRLAAFVRPSVEEVATYCRERGNRIDANAWYDYYTANGWRVGRTAMKDWKAAVRTWERRASTVSGIGMANARQAANWRGTKEEGLTNAY